MEAKQKKKNHAMAQAPSKVSCRKWKRTKAQKVNQAAMVTNHEAPRFPFSLYF